MRFYVLLIFLYLPPLAAQINTANLSGTVADDSGGVIVAAAVTIENEATGARRSTVTDGGGRFHLPQLPPGPYTLTVQMSGFETEVRRGLALSVGREAVVNVVLRVGMITSETVVVSGAPPVELRDTAISGVVDNAAIRELPLNGRDFAQLAMLETGVTPSRRSSDSGGPGTKLVINGNRPSQVSFLLDGSDINDGNNNTPGSVAGVMLGVDTLQEFRVLSNSYSAAYGRSAGGVISAITRSGGNQFHGSVFEFLRNSRLDARNFFDQAGQPIPPFKRHQFGAVVEGPIVRDRTFFLASYEGLRQRLGITNRSVVPTADGRRGLIPGRAPVPVNPDVPPYLDLYPLPNERDFGDGTGEYVTANSRSTGENFVTGRLDHTFSENTSLFGRYTYDAAAVQAPDALNLVRADTTSRNQYFTTQFSRLLSTRALNLFRFSYNRSRSNSEPFFLRPVDPSLSFLPGVPLGQITATGLAPLGPSRFGPSRSLLNLYQWTDDVTYTRGRHALKFGGDHRYIRFPGIRPQSPWGFYQFGSLGDFLQARPLAVELTLPDSKLERDFRQSMTALYVQDDIHLSRRLTLNLGLRYERISVPKEAHGYVSNLRDPLRDAAATVGDPLFENPSNLNFAPRVGLAWDPLGDSRTVIRAGFGLFYDPLWTDFYATAGSRQPPFYTLGSIRNPVFPDAAALIGSPNFVLGRQDVIQFRPEAPYTAQYNLTIQREIGAGNVVTLSYAGQRGIHLARLVDANQAVPEILPDGRKFFSANSTVRNPNFTGIRYKVTDSNSFYNALQLSFDRRLSHGLRFKTSYTYSKNIDEGSITITQGGDNDMPQDPDDRKAERGLSNYDLRHYWVTNFTQDLPALPGPQVLLAGWQWNGIFTAASGNPFSVLVGFDRARARFQAGSNPGRPDLVPGASTNPVLGGPDRYYDPLAFNLPEAGFYGNLGRNTVVGPGLVNFDFSLGKNFPLREGVRLQFRAEVFNLLNHPNFAIPSQRAVFSSTGRVGSAGRITSTLTSARQIQFGLKLVY
jgi:hypothetical protein